MLPSFRLIAATFLCGFFVVFAGLRLASSLNDIHEGLPVMAAHAAPVSITPVADREARRSLAAVPLMYDMRFVSATVAPTLVRLPPMALDQPLSIVPPDEFDGKGSLDAAPEAEAAKDATEPAEPEATVAAIPPAALVIPESAVVPDAPAEQAATDAPAVAAIDSRATPDTTAEPPAAEPPAAEPPAAEQPTAETPAPVTQATANEPQATPTPAPVIEESLPNSEAAAAPAETPAAPTTGPEPNPRSPAAALPAPKPQAAKRQAAKSPAAKSPAAKPQAAKSSPRALVNVARKKLIRVARRAAPTNHLDNTFGSSNGAFATLPGIAQR
jgi:hypothetical protein